LAARAAPGTINSEKQMAECFTTPRSPASHPRNYVSLHRAYGKAPTFSTSDAQAFKRAIDMTDDELAAIVAKARLTIVK
jgi:hypothetical protein